MTLFCRCLGAGEELQEAGARCPADQVGELRAVRGDDDVLPVDPAALLLARLGDGSPDQSFTSPLCDPTAWGEGVCHSSAWPQPKVGTGNNFKGVFGRWIGSGWVGGCSLSNGVDMGRGRDRVS